jgi:hypothetical protein
MKESSTGNITLKDVEVETFISFYKYIYTSAYITADCTLSQEDEGLGPSVNEGKELNFNYIIYHT